MTTTLPSQSVKNVLERAAQHYSAALSGSLAEKYLEERGIPTWIAAGYGLGYVSDPLPGDEEYLGRLAIPYITPAGGVVDLRFRTLGTEGPKYLSRAGAHIRLYNVAALQKTSPVVAVCEGELDTVVVDGCLPDIPAVGVPGAAGWQKHFALLLADYARVVVVADGDQAGRDFAKKVTGILNNAVVAPMPEGMDANDVYLRDGADSLRARIEG